MQRLDRASLTQIPLVPGWEVGLHYRASRLISGDFYDVRAEGSRVTLLLGDVMGKGIPAALLRTGLQGLLKALIPEVSSPAAVLEKANRYFIDSASLGRLATVFYGSLDADSGELRYANAGHFAPLLRRACGDWDKLDSTGLVLGALENATYVEKSVQLDLGNVLALFSDGFTEAENSEGDIFDQRHIARWVDSEADAPAQVIASTVADQLARFAPGEPHDHRTLLMVKRT